VGRAETPAWRLRQAEVGELPQLSATLADVFSTEPILLERNHLQEPHYYIRYVGVATRSQGQGLGTALLRPTLDRCDREGVPAYLEASSERSAALYEDLGFVHLGESQVPDGPRFWPMRRPPAAAESQA
jgi:GNAT superfamily N-acetyltransferase